MAVIKNVLREELQNSLDLKEFYERALKNLPKGSLVKKCIKGHAYFYLVERRHGKVRFTYIGKLLPKEVEKYKKTKESRVKYRNLLSQVKQQIKYLRRVLHGKQEI